jgi:hypothetical protein
LIGDSGAGKTGALAALVNEGYNLRVIDFDNGLDILGNFISPKAKGSLIYETLQDKTKLVNGVTIPVGMPKAVTKAMSLLDHWKTDDEGLGPVSSWGPKDVIVLDSLTFFGLSSLLYVRAINSRGANSLQIQDWGRAMEIQEGVLNALASEAISCNVIVTAHITYIEDVVTAGMRGYPAALGSKLPPKVGRYFNSVLSLRVRGTGTNERRILRTTSEGNLELKNTAPRVIPDEIPLQTDKEGYAVGGLATFFELVQNVGGNVVAMKKGK